MSNNKKHIWMIFTILISATLLRIYFFSGMVHLDDFAYVENAYHLLHSGNYFSLYDGPASTRMGLVLPVALFQAIFGINELFSILFPLICSLGTIFVVYLIGCQLFNKNVGLISAFLLSFLPQHAVISTKLLPDSTAPFFVAMAFYFLLKQKKVNPEKIRYVFCILCSLSIFWAFQIREMTVIFFLVWLIYILLQHKMNFKEMLILLTFLILAILLYLFYSKKCNFMWHINSFTYHELGLRARSCGSASPFQNLEFMFPLPAVLSRATSLNYFVKDFVYSHYIFGFFYYLFLIAFIYSFIRHKSNKQYIILVSWFLIFLLCLEFGSISLKSYFTLKRPRYLALLSPPAVLITAVGIQAFVTNRRRQIICGIILFFLLVYSIFYIRMGWQGSLESIGKYRTTFSFLKSTDAKNIFVTDQVWSLRGRFYYKYREDVKFYLLDEYKPEEIESYIVIDGDFKEYLKEIPGNWQFMRKFGDATVYKTMSMSVRKQEDIIKR